MPAAALQARLEPGEDPEVYLGFFEPFEVWTGTSSAAEPPSAPTDGLLGMGTRAELGVGGVERPVWVGYGDGTHCVGRASGEVFRRVDTEGHTTVSYWNVVEGCPVPEDGTPAIALPDPDASMTSCRAVALEAPSDEALAALRAADPSFGPPACREEPCAVVQRSMVARALGRELGLWQSYTVQGLAQLDCNDARVSAGVSDLDGWVSDGNTRRRVAFTQYPMDAIALTDADGFAFVAGIVSGTWQLFDVAGERLLPGRDALLGPVHPEIHPESIEPQCGP